MSEAAKPENAVRTSSEVVSAFRNAGFYWLLVPKELGGSDRGLADFTLLAEELSSADSSAGWTIAAQGIATMVAANYGSDAHVERMFGGSRLPVVSATYAPSGKAEATKQGYRGGGRYSFGTGIGHADWVSSALVVHENGKPLTQADGRNRVVGAIVPVDRVNILGNWEVVGMEATGSFDYELPEQDVPADWTFNQYWTEPMRASRAATIGTLTAVCAGHTGVALGIARRSLHEAALAATAKKRLFATNSISDNPTFKLDFVRMDALYQAARSRAYAIFKEVDENADAGATPTETEIHRVRQVATWTHQVCRDVCAFAYGSVSSSLRRPSILGRNLFDAAVASQHVIVSDMSLFDASPSIIDQWASEQTASVELQ